jgi:hypothetical protein
MRNGDPVVIELNHQQIGINRNVLDTKKRYKAENWPGAVYYEIIAQEQGKKLVFTLLGWDGADGIRSRKVVETLSVAQGKLRFGVPIIDMGHGSEKRLIMEYADAVTAMLRWREDLRMIVMDHLSAPEPQMEGNTSFYGPDMTYDALVWQKNHWVLKEDVEIRDPDMKKPWNNPKRSYPLYLCGMQRFFPSFFLLGLGMLSLASTGTSQSAVVADSIPTTDQDSIQSHQKEVQEMLQKQLLEMTRFPLGSTVETWSHSLDMEVTRGGRTHVQRFWFNPKKNGSMIWLPDSTKSNECLFYDPETDRLASLFPSNSNGTLISSATQRQHDSHRIKACVDLDISPLRFAPNRCIERWQIHDSSGVGQEVFLASRWRQQLALDATDSWVFIAPGSVQATHCFLRTNQSGWTGALSLPTGANRPFGDAFHTGLVRHSSRRSYATTCSHR